MDTSGTQQSGLIDNAAEHRFEMPLEDDERAVSYYRIEDNRIYLLHTEVPQRFSGQGIGTRFATAIFERLKSANRRVIAKCPFMAAFAVKHPEYSRMLDG
jgi:predicted GNAT family acetyltransferase